MTEKTDGRGSRGEAALDALTFWLRPAFVLRCVNRFQRLAGFDRAVGLAASALTALIPLAIVSGAVLSELGGRDAAERIIDRYDLSGGGAEAVRDALAPATGTATSVSVFGLLLLALAVLSFTRAAQRLIERGWDLAPLSVRNTVNGLYWIGGLALYTLLSGWVRALLGRGWFEIDASLAVLPLSAVFLVWTGWMLSGKRLRWQRLLPFGVAAAALLAAYSVAADVYLPHLFSSYASRYGVIGAAFAMIAGLLGAMVALVIGAAVGRELGDELERLRRGERPPEHEVRREWDAVVAEARLRWETLRERASRSRERRDRHRERG